MPFTAKGIPTDTSFLNGYACHLFMSVMLGRVREEIKTMNNTFVYESNVMRIEEHLPLIHDDNSLHLDRFEYMLSLLPNYFHYHHHRSLLLMADEWNIIDEVEI